MSHYLIYQIFPLYFKNLVVLFIVGNFINIAFAIHPMYNIMSLRPGSGKNQWAPVGIGGMDWLPNGRMAVCSWGGNQGHKKKIPKKEGHLFLLEGVVDATSPDDVKVRELDLGHKLFECQGLKVVDGDIYVLEKPRITKVVDKSGDGSFNKLETSTFATGWDMDETEWHHFSLNLVFDGKDFYFNTASAWPIKDESVERAATIRVPKNSPGKYEVVGGGIRNPDGLGLGPEGELFATINQGEYNPANNMVNMRKDRYFGMATTPLRYKPDWSKNPSTWENNGPNIDPATPNHPNKCWPVTVWLDHRETAASPGEPFFVKQGPYKGQMFVCDNGSVGGIRRVFLERIKGEYQGCVFYFIDGEFKGLSNGANNNKQGLEAGANRLLRGPKGALYVGCVGGGSPKVNGVTIGGSPNWNWKQTWTGLQRLKPNGTKIFEMYAVRSLPSGFEIEFSQPAANGAEIKSNYKLSTYWHKRQRGYGKGHQENKRGVDIQSVELSRDKRRVKVNLKQEDLIKRNEYRFDLSGIKSAKGENLFDGKAWYTLNRIGPADILGCKDPASPSFNADADYDDGLQCAETNVGSKHYGLGAIGMQIQCSKVVIANSGWHIVDVLNLKGNIIHRLEGTGPLSYPLNHLSPGVYFFSLKGKFGRISKKAALIP